MYNNTKTPYVPFEVQYLRILLEIASDAVSHPDRTGTGRRSITSRMMKINLATEFPLITTQRVFVRGAFEELKWMLSGSTNVKDLHAKDIRFWDAWALGEEHLTDEALDTVCDKLGVSSRYKQQNIPESHASVIKEKIFKAVISSTSMPTEGSIGNLYGKNWRGTNSPDNRGTSTKHDQIQGLLQSIENDRYGSRHILTTLIPDHLSDRRLSPQENALIGKGALYPCHGIHLQFQILPQKDGKKDILHSFVTARSQDWAVGTIINVAFYAFFTHLIAKHFDLALGEMTYVGVDIHIYENQLDSVNEQLHREVNSKLPLPQIRINDSELTGNKVFDADGNCTVQWEDIEFTTPYTPMAHIKHAVSI